ncbi:hypothetical protein TNCV_2002981 [Trichonephila clavipes]|nr:hypothetical protein TNCV_2002981 [Trichonephila clavipes]
MKIEQRPSRFGPIRRIYALLDDRFDELPNQTENKSLDSCPSGSNDSSDIGNDNLHDSAESYLRASLVDNGLVGPYSATVLVTLPSAPDHRPPRLASAR